MLPRRHRLNRLLFAVLAALQLGVPPFIALADATLAARASASAPTEHVEDYGRRDAVASHPDDCALCQVLRLASAPAKPAPALHAERASSTPAPSDRGLVETVANRRLPDTRAPPTAQ